MLAATAAYVNWIRFEGHAMIVSEDGLSYLGDIYSLYLQSDRNFLFFFDKTEMRLSLDKEESEISIG